MLIRARACSINYRDSLIPKGFYMGGVVNRDITPLLERAGQIEAVGASVTQYNVGDRVAATFFQRRVSGQPSAAAGPALCAPPANCMLTEYLMLPEYGVVPFASSLSFVEAATLPWAGITAWDVLKEGIPLVRPSFCVKTVITF